MMKSESKQNTSPPLTVLTLTLPQADMDTKTSTLLVQRGDLAHLHQFTYERVADLTEVIADALIAFAALEADPPIIREAPAKSPAAKKANPPATPAEPTVDIPLKKGTKAVKISYLKLVGGETDAAAYQQAVHIAGKLIDGKLWDGESPIRIDDVYALAKKMKHLTERDLSLFTLEDFVTTGEADAEAAASLDEAETDDEPPTVEMPDQPLPSANGHLHTDVPSEQSSLL